MNPAHFHLALNHVPVLGTAFGMLLILFAVARDNEAFKKLSLVVFVIAAVAALPTYLSGEGAEEVVEHLPGVAEALIEAHEEAGGVAAAAMALLGALSLAGLVRFRRPPGPPRWLTVACLALSVVVTALMLRAANLGGQIRHSEIRPAASGAPAAD